MGGTTNSTAGWKPKRWGGGEPDKSRTEKVEGVPNDRKKRCKKRGIRREVKKVCGVAPLRFISGQNANWVFVFTEQYEKNDTCGKNNDKRKTARTKSNVNYAWLKQQLEEKKGFLSFVQKLEKEGGGRRTR